MVIIENNIYTSVEMAVYRATMGKSLQSSRLVKSVGILRSVEMNKDTIEKHCGLATYLPGIVQ